MERRWNVKNMLIALSALAAIAGCAHGSKSSTRSTGQGEAASAASASEEAGQREAASAQSMGQAADNTAVNQRDQQASTTTPLDQGESARDVALTKMIRASVVANDSLSFEAKNVKIVTQNGKVTLRGPVKSKEESQTIERSAEEAAGVDNVANQLEIEQSE